MDYDEFTKKAKDIIEIEFHLDKLISPKMILSEANILDYMEARTQKQANGLVIVDLTLAGHQLGGGEIYKNYVAMMMETLREQKQLYIYVSEAYYCEGTTGEVKSYFNKHGTLKDHPESYDCLLMNYYDGESIGVIVNKIVNAETKHAFLTKWYNPDPDNLGKQSGRFTDEKDNKK